MASGDQIDDGCLSKLLDDGIVLLTTAVAKIKQAAAAVLMKICACCGNQEPPIAVEEGGEVAGQPTTPAELIVVPEMFNMGWRWRLLGLGSDCVNDGDVESGPSVQLAEAAGGGGARVLKLPLEEIKEVVYVRKKP